MNCYLKALEEGDGSDDELTKARLYVAQGNIYESLMEWEKCAETNLAATLQNIRCKNICKILGKVYICTV